MKNTTLWFTLILWGCQAAWAAPSTPSQSVHHFYRHYFSYLKSLRGKSRQIEVAQREDRSATEPYLTPRFARKRMAQLAHCAASPEPGPGCEGDPFYCAQEEPLGFVIKRTSRTTDSAWVLLEMNFGPQGKREVRVRVDRSGGKWLIDRVRCPKQSGNP